VCCPLAFLPNELRPQKCKSLGWHSETPNSETGTNLTVDRISVQSHPFECLNTLLLLSLVMLFTTKGIYLNEACSGFELESAVRFRTWTWKVGNTFSSISHSSLTFIFFFRRRDTTGSESTVFLYFSVDKKNQLDVTFLYSLFLF